MRYTLIFVLFVFVSIMPAIAQTGGSGRLQELSPELSILELSPSIDHIYMLNAEGKPITSLTFRITLANSFSNSFVVVGNNKINLELDEHALIPASNQSLPVVFDTPIEKLEVHLPSVDSTFKVFLINTGTLANSARTAGELKPIVKSTPGCESPVTIDQSEWRQGLQPPNYSRSYTETEHLIVHHSATSNTLTDYYNVVRNIYVYHTQVNGWSDIGYNYLVAPDGTIFNGRDPADGEQDLVLGAHFCGKNSTTMGVCMIGDYRSIEPTEEAVQSLEALLAWKVEKDGLDVFGNSSHPLNQELPTIAGHRQGCATMCPGDKVFEKLATIRQDISDQLDACKDVLIVSNVTIYPNPTEGDLLIELPKEKELEAVDFITLNGQKHSVGVINEGLDGYRAVTSFLQPGVYIVMFKLKNELPEFKKVILQ